MANWRVWTGDDGGFHRPSRCGFFQDPQLKMDLKPLSSNERPTSSTGITSAGSWGFSSIFGSSENRGYTDKPTGNTISDSLPIDLTFSTIRLKEPPSILRPSDKQTENEASEIAITKLLLRSYYDIVRKNIQDSVPKAIMHFLVNHAKRQLLSTFIQKVYREEQFSILLNEREEVAIKRRRIMEMYHVLQQAVSTLDELPIDLDEASYSRSGTDVAARRSGSMSSNHSASNGDIHEMAHTTAPPLKNQRRHKSTDSWEKTQPSFSSD
ncbi:hypothetical protein ZOSMA_164G00350 [Zostera marina]|uniref:GED domain-containing protein n=1 Tax=Zostera marina TaxID=29655 RepID=A0A0K9PTS3_ZOSMR|nr:hypothetical protein ZOSMA_164G00350 [Zostera marina]